MVILGMKSKENGSIKVYDEFSVGTRKQHTDISLNETLTVGGLGVFPHANFSRLDYAAPAFEGFNPTYLWVDADITEEEMKNMRGGDKSTYSFKDRKVTFLSEFEKPFEYGLQQLKKYGDSVGTYNLTTWIIHEEARTPKEFECMCEILHLAIEHYENTPHTLDLSLDKYVLKYIDFLKDYKEGSFTFGKYGSIDLTKEEIKQSDISLEGYIRLLKTVPYHYHVLVHHPYFNLEFYKEVVEKDPTFESNVVAGFYDRVIPELNDIGFDMDYLFSRIYQYKLQQYCYEDAYNSIRDLVLDMEYKPVTKTYDPYDDYCCEECDGYMLNAEPYDYVEDLQVEFLYGLVEDWKEFLSEKSAPLFKDWNKDIFVRYLKEYPDDKFVSMLV